MDDDSSQTLFCAGGGGGGLGYGFCFLPPCGSVHQKSLLLVGWAS